MQIPEEILDLIINQLTEVITPEERVTLNQWIASNPDHHEAYKSTYELGYAAILAKRMERIHFESGKEELFHKWARRKARKRAITAISIAASIALLLGAWWLFSPSSIPPEPVPFALREQANVTLVLSTGEAVDRKSVV